MAASTTRALQPFVPRLLHEWGTGLHERVDGSLVFVDVSGFTRMSERLARIGNEGAEEVTEIIDATFASLLAEAYAFEGSLLKFGGDALLLFFGDDGHASRAAAAAHAMRDALRRKGTFGTSAGRVTLRMSIGAHTGELDFFVVGRSHRELIVAGPAATEVVTVEGAASAGQILVSKALAEALPPAHRGRHLGPGVLLRGAPDVERTTIGRLATSVDLTPFVPLALRETILESDIEPEHRPVTIAFVAFDGLDSLIAASGPDAAARELARLVADVQAAVDGRGVTFLGTDIAPDGGKIILASGAPVVSGSDEESMLLALGAILGPTRRLTVHVGVNSGPVYAGVIGPPFRRTFTVMGDAVNLAARLAANARPGTVVATPVVLDGSRTLFATTERAPFAAKGKRRPVRSLEVGAPRGTRSAVAGAGLPLVGRDVELAALERAWACVLEGRGQVVELVADAGMGKSRLLDELLARTEGAPTVTVECRLYQSATPYFPFRSLLATALGLEELGEEARAAGLERIVAEHAPALARWLSLIGIPLGLALPPSPDVDALDDRFRKQRLEESVAGLLEAMLSEPIVVTVEDIHWMDEASRELLAHLSTSLQRSPVLFVLTRRSGTESPFAGRHVTRIELAPLSTQQTEELIRASTLEAPLLPEQVRTLARRAGGSPLYLIELLDALRRGDDVDTLPRSVEGLIQARIDRVPPGDRKRLRRLAVLGNGFRSEHARVVLTGGPPSDASRATRGLEEFLSVDDSGWVEFRHALIRDAAYEGLAYRTRRELHARVADAILASAGAGRDSAAELLAIHYSQAGRWTETWRYARIAGDHARSVYANSSAASFYERALAAGRRLRVPDTELATLWSALGTAREQAGEFSAAFDAFRVATRLRRDDPVGAADAHLHRARTRIRTGSYVSALRETRAGLRRVSSLDAAAARRAGARLTALRGEIRLLQGHPRDAITLAARALEDAEETAELEALARACTVLDGAYQMLGEPERAVNEPRALEIYRELGQLGAAAAIKVNLGVQAYADGRWTEAVDWYTGARDDFLTAGNEPQSAIAGANLGEVLVSRRRLREAHVVLVEALSVLRAAGLTPYAIFAEIQLARLALEEEREDDALEVLSRLRDEASSLGHSGIALEVSIAFATALTRSGEASRSLTVLEQARRAAGAEAALLDVPMRRARAAALASSGRPDDARVELDAALAGARAQHLLYEQALTLVARCELAVARGLEPDAEELREHRRLLELLGVDEAQTVVLQPSMVENT